MSTIASEIARSNDVFIKHNFDNHDGEVPVWAAVEVLSFGTISKIIKNLKTGTGSSYSILASNYQYKSQKGNWVNPSQKMLSSWIQGVSVLRNKCAHNSRIYNRTIHTTPEILDIDKIMPLPAHNGLYQSLLAMKYLKPSDEEWMSFVDEFDKFIQKNNSIISIKIVIGRGIAAINSKSGFQNYLFYALKERFFKDDILGNGAIFASISKNELLNQVFVIPDKKIMSAYEKIAAALDKKIEVVDMQLQQLVEARDRLLPKLMNGEIEV